MIESDFEDLCARKCFRTHLLLCLLSSCLYGPHQPVEALVQPFAPRRTRLLDAPLPLLETGQTQRFADLSRIQRTLHVLLVGKDEEDGRGEVRLLQP